MTEGYIEKSVDILQEDLEKINKFTRSDFDMQGLYVFSVVLCNNDIDRDYEKFSLEALYELADAFVGKTGICDHSMKSSDQKARIFDAWVEQIPNRRTADGEDFYCLKAKAYMVRSEENASLITEIEAGIKKEISVSCKMGSAVCSICSADKRKGRCSHIAGRTYDSKTAYTVLSDTQDAYEFSFVAVPAQREAGVTKSFDLSKGDADMSKIIDTLKGCDSQLVLSKTQASDVAEYIEKLEDEAQLGRDYKKSLADEVVALCAVAMPEMDIKTFGSVASVMTVNELKSFKKAFSKSKAPACKPQINSAGSRDSFEQFKI